MSKAKFEWLIRGYDSTTLIFETRLSAGLIGSQKVEALLKTLTAKAGLTMDEIVASFVKRGTKGSNQHLQIRRDPQHNQITCGSNPHFIAHLKRIKLTTIKS
jgi:hypothetical protein